MGVFQGGLQFYSKSIRFPAATTMDGNQPKEKKSDLKKPLRVALITADEQVCACINSFLCFIEKTTTYIVEMCTTALVIHLS